MSGFHSTKDEFDGVLSTTSDVDLRLGNTIIPVAINIASSGDNTIVAASANKKIKVLSYIIIAAAAVDVTWKAASTAISGAMSIDAKGGAVAPASAPGAGHYLETAINEALKINLSDNIQVSGHLTYYLE